MQQYQLPHTPKNCKDGPTFGLHGHQSQKPSNESDSDLSLQTDKVNNNKLSKLREYKAHQKSRDKDQPPRPTAIHRTLWIVSPIKQYCRNSQKRYQAIEKHDKRELDCFPLDTNKRCEVIAGAAELAIKGFDMV